MQRIKLIVGMFLIAAVLLSQAGCALLTAPTVAVAAGKIVYDKVKDDKAKDEESKVD